MYKTVIEGHTHGHIGRVGVCGSVCVMYIYRFAFRSLFVYIDVFGVPDYF